MNHDLEIENLKKEMQVLKRSLKDLLDICEARLSYYPPNNILLSTERLINTASETWFYCNEKELKKFLINLYPSQKFNFDQMEMFILKSRGITEFKKWIE